MTTSLQNDATHTFSPMLGPLEGRLLDLLVALPHADDVRDLVEAQTRQAVARLERDPDPRELCWAFSISVLSDLLAAGGTIQIVDSTLLAAWPHWESSEGRTALRRALLRLRDEKRIVQSAAKLAHMPGMLTPRVLMRVMVEGVFRLASQDETNQAGVTYQNVFRRARQYWTMPDRDREGRSKRFVLTVDHPLLGRSTPVGILEASDGPPHDTVRDARLGLTSEAFREWLTVSSRRPSDLEGLGRRLKGLRDALLPIESLKRVRPKDIYRRRRELELLAAGRSRVRGDLAQQKRLGYLIRIVRAEEAVRQLRRGESADDGDVYALVRLLRDLTVPRTHVEISICGSLPPFSVALGGKMVAAFIADPRVRAMCKTPPGEIARAVFRPRLLSSLIPSVGALLLTTKGLYPGHSAQYERVVLPGKTEADLLPLRRIGNTIGITASLVSKRSYALATRYLEAMEGWASVSGTFGSGGNKRQRRIEAAAQLAGLPQGIIHPGIRRPIYAAELAANIPDVVLLNRTPEWRIQPRISKRSYAERTVAVWRARWAETALRRVDEHLEDRVLGFQEWLTGREVGP